MSGIDLALFYSLGLICERVEAVDAVDPLRSSQKPNPSLKKDKLNNKARLSTRMLAESKCTLYDAASSSVRPVSSTRSPDDVSFIEIYIYVFYQNILNFENVDFLDD